MKRNMQARILAASLLGVLAIAVARKTWLEGAGPSVSTPEDAIYAVMNATRAGNVNHYLDGYTGPMRAGLQRSRDESGGAAFARYLQSSNAGVKGLAVKVESCGEREA